MSIFVNVHLLSGKCASIEVKADASVESLKHRAQSALVVPGRGRLLNSSGEVLDRAQTITEAKLRSGDVLTLHVNQVHIQASLKPWSPGARPPLVATECSAFAATSWVILGDGSVVTWGDAD